MKTAIKICMIYTVRFLLSLLRLVPVNQQKIIFTSYGGKQYSCNPKYLYEYLQSRYPGRFTMVWALNEPGKYEALAKQGVRLVRYKSAAYVYHLCTAKVIVDNQTLPSFVPVRPSQCFINTWHGGGAYKRVGIHVTGDPLVKKQLKMTGDETTLFISSCRRFSEVMSEAYLIDRSKMLEQGMPRNDLLMRPCEKVRHKVKSLYGIPDDRRLVLYAPTFRGSHLHADWGLAKEQPLDTEACLQALEETMHAPFSFAFRAHHSMIPEVLSERQIDASAYPDMQELLCAADVLITDYSSSMWDFSLTGRPCFLYAPDIDNYKQERDFYTPAPEWPFPIAADNEQMVNNIRAFNASASAGRIADHHRLLGSFESGHASQTVGDIIYEFCFGKDGQ